MEKNGIPRNRRKRQ